MDNGTPSKTVGRFAELASAVVAQLPREIDPQTALRWIEHQRELRDALHTALTMPDWVSSTTLLGFEVRVDYNQSTEEMIKAGNYDYCGLDPAKYRFEIRFSGKTILYLVRFSNQKYLEPREVVETLDQQSLRPAELPELLAFGAQYPEVQKRFSVIALGSTQPHPGEPLVAVLGSDQRPRVLMEYKATCTKWKDSRCAAVPK